MRPAPHRAPYVAALIGLAIVAAVASLLSLARGSDPVPVPPAYVPTPPGAAGGDVEPVEDPFTYDPEDREQFERRAAAGNAHVLYARSPGGAVATARRVARWRPQVERAAKAAGIDAGLLEALVFLESAGREDALTPAGIEGAAGLTQIVAETGVNLLGMRVDTQRSARYGRRIARELRRARLLRVQRLRAARARVDERFDPGKALAGTARYLRMAKQRFGTWELALVSYHMGMGNLEGVLRAYVGGNGERPIGEVVSGRALTWAQVYFDSSPLRHAPAHAKLAALGDDSSNYFWKLLAARDVMAMHRSDPAALERAAVLHEAKNSAEEVLHPPGSTERFGDPGALRQAWAGGDLIALPRDTAATGLRLDPRMGELARRLRQPVSIYRGLRPEALAVALYIGAQVRAIDGDPRASLTVTSTVRDGAYQRALRRRNTEAAQEYSLHTTGWAFDVLRRYRSRRHALAFQFVLDRLQSLNVIAWVREPAAIHITAGRDAKALLPLLRVIGIRPR